MRLGITYPNCGRRSAFKYSDSSNQGSVMFRSHLKIYIMLAKIDYIKRNFAQYASRIQFGNEFHNLIRNIFVNYLYCINTSCRLLEPTTLLFVNIIHMTNLSRKLWQNFKFFHYMHDLNCLLFNTEQIMNM